MNNYIMVGCDLHDKSMLIKLAHNRAEPVQKSFNNTPGGRKKMISILKESAEAANNARIVFAYEASSLGFGLHDELTDVGIDCYVFAPTNIPRSVKHRRRKTDARDAQRILEIVRGHFLAGNKMPTVWIPDPQTRDDRELVRMRLGVGKKITAIKAQINILLKRNKFRKPGDIGNNWTKKHRTWLAKSAGSDSALSIGASSALNSLLRQLAAMEEEVIYLDKQIRVLAQTDRYAIPVRELSKLKGVGIFTAMVYLTEMGDLSRFKNRQQVGSYLGLVPSSYETGNTSDRKGHITHHGPGRVTRVLCQACWSRVRTDQHERAVHKRICDRNPKHKKIALVACMRRLGIKMWHDGLKAQLIANSFTPKTNQTTA